jgi:hypothetical protein
MKTPLFLLFLLPTVIFAQTYVPFITTSDSSDTWKDINSCTDFDCYNTYTNRFTIEGDTIIGGLQYVKIYAKTKHEQGTDQGQWCDESTTYYEFYYGAVRESGKRVYVIPDVFNPIEYLAYDFNLTIGDTMPSPDGNIGTNPLSRIINLMDSVLVFGSYRKRYLVSSNKYVVEGVGSSKGLFNPLDFNTSNCDMRMLCYSEYDTPDYFLLDCEMNLSINTLTSDDMTRCLIKIVDYLGRETELKPNTPLIYIYSDGTAEKVFRVEE